MSHVCEIRTKLTDLDAIKAACDELGLTFKSGQQTYKWYGYSVDDHPLPHGFQKDDLGKCEHAIGVPGTDWEVGVCRRRNPDGSLADGYTLLCDFWGSKGRPIFDALGGTADGKEMTFSRFTQAYAVAKATKAAKAKGYLVRRVAGKNGAVQLVVTGF